MLIDSHVHLDFPAFDHDRAAVLSRAAAADVQQLVIPGVAASGWGRIRALCAGQPTRLFAAYGIHPLHVDATSPAAIATLPDWLTEHAAHAVGEIGLDFHVAGTDPGAQRQCLAAQLAIARDLGLPVILHARQALEEIILTLRKHPGVRGVVHSFSGSEEQAHRLHDMGFLLGIGGVVTYPRAQRLRRIVARLPADQLLLESDAPDQPGIAHRGERNEPAFVAEVAACIATLRGEPVAALAAATSANARALFRLPLPATV